MENYEEKDAQRSAHLSAMWAHSADLVISAMRALREVFADDEKVILATEALETEGIMKFLRVVLVIDEPLAKEVARIVDNDNEITMSDALHAGVMNMMFGETGEQD